MSDEFNRHPPHPSKAVYVDDRLIEALLRGERPHPSLPPEAGELLSGLPDDIVTRPTATEALPAALALLEQDDLEGAIATLEQGAQAGEDPLEIQNALAQLRFEQGRWDLAEKGFAAIVRMTPNKATAHYNLGLALERQGKFGKAATEFEAAASIDSQLWQAHAALGVCLLHTGKPTLAGHCFDQSLELHPNQYRSRFGKAVTAHKLGRYSEAEAAYTALLQDLKEPSAELASSSPDGPDPMDLLINLMRVSWGVGKHDEAREYAQTLLEADPRCRPALEQLTSMALEARDYRTALPVATQLVQAVPESYEAWFNLGVCYHKTGLFEEARQAYQQALRIQPDCAEANANLGAVLQQSDQIELAREAYGKALAASPSLPGVLWNLALAAETDGRLDEAETYLHQLLEYDPSWEEATFRLGYIQLQKGDFQTARRSFESCVATRGDWVEALLNLGLACWQTDDLPAARSALEKILALQPSNPDALKGLIAIGLEAQQEESAWTHHQRLMATSERSVELSFNLGLMMQQAGDPARAVASYQHALEAQPDYAPALINLGYALDAQGRSSDARAYWSKAITADAAFTAEYFD